MEPYAVYLLRRFNAGESVDQLVATEGIRRDRVIARLRAALGYVGNKGPLAVQGIALAPAA